MQSKKLKGFSTVEGIVSGVILSVIMILVYSTIGKTMDEMNSISILRGASAYESWLSEQNEVGIYQNETTLNFIGGKTEITLSAHPDVAGLWIVSVEIKNDKNEKMMSWKELSLIP